MTVAFTYDTVTSTIKKNAKKRNSNFLEQHRELSDGARQSGKKSELTSEQGAEEQLCRHTRKPTVIRKESHSLQRACFNMN